LGGGGGGVGGISPIGEKTETSATSSKDFFGKLSKNWPYFLEKKKKRKNFARFRQLVRVARLDCRIQKKNSTVRLGQSPFNAN
jgi:hypothetical protein